MTSETSPSTPDARSASPGRPAGGGSALEVLGAFTRLGFTSFGGPIAHLGYFREEFVTRRQWLSDQAYADLVALCQFLPGPASSQAGFALGVMRAGLRGGLMAWLGFTLPSALVMVAVALGARLFDSPLAQSLLHGLKLVAVAVVAQAVWGMARSLCPDGPRAVIAFAGLAAVLLMGGQQTQLFVIGAAAVAGLVLCRGAVAERAANGMDDGAPPAVSRLQGGIALALFAGVLAAVPLLAGGPDLGRLFAVFYEAGALVFGGGHVVLPLLEAQVVAPGDVSADAFLAGYGAAQAVPGPLFTFAAYLGVLMPQAPAPLAGAAIALLGLFLPGLLLVYGALPFWHGLRRSQSAQAMLAGVNAGVVGLLAAALYQPIWTSTVLVPADFVVAAGAFLLLTVGKAPPWAVVAATAAAAMLAGTLA